MVVKDANLTISKQQVDDLHRIAELCTMKILLVAATALELKGLEGVLLSQNTHSLHTAVTGIGLVASTYMIMHEIKEIQPDLVIQAGIAGSFNGDLRVGSAVVVENEIVADLGVYEEEGYRNIFAMGLADPNEHPYQNGCLVNPHAPMLQKTGLQGVSSVSVNEITTDPKKIDLFSRHYKADIESMEGAALHHVCIMEKIPFVQIRGISNRVGVRDKQLWEIKAAMKEVSMACTKLIDRL